MRAKLTWLCTFLIAGVAATAFGQDAKQLVQQAVQNELAKDQADHSHWLYFENDVKPGHPVKQWVAETAQGSIKRILQVDGHVLSPDEQRRKMDAFIADPSARSKQHKSEAHDDEQATEMLRMLPQAFIWTHVGEQGNNTLLHFKPDPNFHPPDLEARVFAAMEGDMAVDMEQHRIASLKGTLIRDVKIFGGILGQMNSGGTFDVERRETGKGVWQITETHVHIQGHALIFKTISEQEDDVKTSFKPLPDSIDLQQAEQELLKTEKEK